MRQSAAGVILCYMSFTRWTNVTMMTLSSKNTTEALMNISKIFTIVTSFAIMFTIAIASGIRGLLVPNFMTYFDVSGYQIGLLFSITTAISVVGAFLTAPFCTKFGYKTTILAGILINAASFYLTSKATGFGLFTLGYCVITLGVTFAVTSLNTVVTVIKVSFQAVLVNMIHFFFGLGITVSQKFGGDLVVMGFNWQDFFLGMTFVYIVAAVVLLFVQYPKVTISGKTGGYRDIPNKKFVMAVCIALGLYVSAELQTGNWMINYLHQVYGYSEDNAGLYAAIFFGTFSVGRFLGGFIAEKLGYVRSVSLFISMASVLFIAGLLMGESGLLILSCSGFFFSLIFPTVTLYLADLYPKHKAAVISLLSTVCNFLSLVSSFLIGYLNDQIGTALAFWLIPVCLVLGAVLFIYTHREAPVCE